MAPSGIGSSHLDDDPLDLAFGLELKRCKIGTPISYDGKHLAYVNYVWPYIACFNASGHPSIAIPLGLGKDGCRSACKWWARAGASPSRSTLQG